MDFVAENLDAEDGRRTVSYQFIDVETSMAEESHDMADDRKAWMKNSRSLWTWVSWSRLWRCVGMAMGPKDSPCEEKSCDDKPGGWLANVQSEDFRPCPSYSQIRWPKSYA